jgi:hypothetical protein
MTVLALRSIGALAGVLVACTFGCARNHRQDAAVQSASTPTPTYFALMQIGHDLEGRKDYSAAISKYREADGQIEPVASDMRRQARIAVHNRIAACLVKVGDPISAVREFQLSASLGDSVYAPKWIIKLQKSRVGTLQNQSTRPILIPTQ